MALNDPPPSALRAVWLTFRALAAAHLLGSWNRLGRQAGVEGRAAVVALYLLLVLSLVLPLLAGFGALGYLLGETLSDGGPGLPLGGALLTLFPVVAGGFGGLSSGSRQLPWETLRGFPVRPTVLFGAELFAGGAEAVTLIELAAQASLLLGVAVAVPRAAPLLLVLLTSHTLLLLAFQQLIGSLAERMARRVRLLLLLLPLTAVSMPWLIEQLRAAWGDRGPGPAWSALQQASSLLPASRLLAAAADTLQGRADPTDLLLAALAVAGSALGAVVLAYHFVSRERALDLDLGGGHERLWTFRSPTFGIARLQWQALASSLPGRFGLMVPLFTVVLVRGPLATFLPSSGWAVPLAFAYAAMAGANLLFNQFGLDRHGVKVLLLLPIEPEALLRGKLLGFAAWQALQALLLVLLLSLGGRGTPTSLLTGVLLYACIFLVLALVGQRVSLWLPRPLKKNGLRAGQPPFLLMLLVTLTTLGTTGGLFGLLLLLRHFVASWAPLGLVVVTGALTLCLGPALRWNARYLVESRERLVETLGASG